MRVAFTARAAVGLALAMALAVTACSHKSGSAHQTGVKDARQVTVVGHGQVKGTPDTLSANVSIQFSAPDATTAMNKTNERQQAVINALVGSGVDRNDISTTGVTLQPQMGGAENNTIVGYRATNSIEVRIRRLDSASQALGLIVTTGGDATRINSVAYSIEDTSQLVRDARSRAFDDAKARAEQYATLSGVKLGRVLTISETAESSGSPATAAPLPAASANVPLEPGQRTVGFSVTVAWELT